MWIAPRRASRCAKGSRFAVVSAGFPRNISIIFLLLSYSYCKENSNSLDLPLRQFISDPTIKYWKDGEEEDYQGGRDYASLKKFVEDELEVKCNVNDPSECSEKERGYIEKMKVKTAEERASQLARLDGMTGGKMKAELRQWLGQRIRILKQLDEDEGGDDEF